MEFNRGGYFQKGDIQSRQVAQVGMRSLPGHPGLTGTILGLPVKERINFIEKAHELNGWGYNNFLLT